MNAVVQENRFAQPQKVTGLDVAFGGDMRKLLPPMSEIPAEFKNDRNPWCQWQSKWFFSGLKEFPAAKPGIDKNAAIGHLKAIQGSFDPSHEHKQAAVAYLASLWLV